MDRRSHYAVLSISDQASAGEIRRAYQALARKYHPDRFRPSDGELRGETDPEGAHFRRVQEAWEALRDESARRKYDAWLAEQTRSVAVADELALADMIYSDHDGVYRHGCRCGDVFELAEPEIVGDCVEVIGCNGCSLYIAVSSGPSGSGHDR
ncbi:unnamed protein product [Phaeothamnion confervicola]